MRKLTLEETYEVNGGTINGAEIILERGGFDGAEFAGVVAGGATFGRFAGGPGAVAGGIAAGGAYYVATWVRGFLSLF